MENIRKKLLAIEEEMVVAYNEGDFDKFLYYFDEEMIGFSSTAQNRLGGLEELKKTMEFYYNQSEISEYQISSPVVQVFDGFAIVSFYWNVSMINGTDRKEINGRGSHVFTKQGDHWKIVHEHFSKTH